MNHYPRHVGDITIALTTGQATAPRMTDVTALPEPPYPREIRARGWRFEFDTERIRTSDTWAIASAELRPWLLMLWMTAWDNHPVGLPGDERAIAGQIGMQLQQFQASRETLLRGWQMCSDGRLYHPVLTERVLEMIEKRRKDAARMAIHRAQKNQEPTSVVTRYSRVSSPEVRHPPPTTSSKTQSIGRLATPDLPPGFVRFWQAYPNRGRRKNRAACLQLWAKLGLEARADAVVSHVTAMSKTRGWLPDAEGNSYEPEAERYLRRRNFEDDLPDAVEPAAAKPVAARWWDSEAGTKAKGAELGLRPRNGESWNDFRGRIRERLGA